MAKFQLATDFKYVKLASNRIEYFGICIIGDHGLIDFIFAVIFEVVETMSFHF